MRDDFGIATVVALLALSVLLAVTGWIFYEAWR